MIGNKRVCRKVTDMLRQPIDIAHYEDADWYDSSANENCLQSIMAIMSVGKLPSGFAFTIEEEGE